MMKYFACVLLVATQLFYSCGVDVRYEGKHEKGLRVIIDRSSYEAFQEDRLGLFTLTKIRVTEEVAEKIGTPLEDFLVIGDRMIAVNRRQGVISSVLANGTIEWQVQSKPDDPTSFRAIDIVNYNEFKKVIEVCDPESLSFYSYGLDGEFKGKEMVDFNFQDRVPLSNDSYLYNISPYPNRDMFESRYEYLVVDKGVKKPFSISHEVGLRQHSFIDYDVISKFDDGVYYHRNFSDSVFHVTDGTKELAYIVGFGANVTSGDILLDKKVKNKFEYLINNGIPFFDDLEASNGKVFLLYESPESFRLVVVDQKSELQLFHAKFIVKDGDVIRCPYIHRHGYFLTEMMGAEVDFFEKNEERILSDPEAVVSDYQVLSAEIGDRGDVVFYLLKPN